MTETPRQYSARRIRVRIERAKVAIMEAQEETARPDCRIPVADIQSLTEAALARLDKAWCKAFQIEQAEKELA